jgi:hypothetical protein
VAATVTLLLPLARRRADGATRSTSLILSGAALLFTAAASSVTPSHVAGTSAVWVGLGLAAALAGLNAIDGRRSLPRSAPPVFALAIVVGAALFVVGLFLPWQRVCSTASSGVGVPFAGRCVTQNAWDIVGSSAALLALALAVVALAAHYLRVSAFELAAGLALLTVALGSNLESDRLPGYRIEWGYGPIVSFCGAGLLVALTLARFQWRKPKRNRLRAVVPLVACVVYLVIIVVPWWYDTELDTVFPLSWLTIAGMLLVCRLLYRWARLLAGATTDWESVALPLALIPLFAVDLLSVAANGTRRHNFGWGTPVEGSLMIGLALLLAVFGYVEQRGGIPEILRVDRI